jgi:subtilisin family serine protease
MPERCWKVAVIDSGLAPQMVLPVRTVRRFLDEGDRVTELDAIADRSGHGSVVAGIITSAPRPIELVIAQVLDHEGRSTAAAVAAAMEWAGTQGAELLHLSLGLHQDRPILRMSIERMVAAGRVVVASSPARGSTVYPAAYPGVIRATGDARCGLHEVSCLGTPEADFGACPVSQPGSRPSRGASIGAAHLSRFIVAHVEPGAAAQSVRATLERLAAFHGRERRRGFSYPSEVAP